MVNKAYSIKVKNNKNVPVKLNLMDQVPISQHRDIKVSNVETGDAKYNEDDGLMSWNLQLQPTNGIEKILSYSVKYPKNKRISL